MSKIQKGSQLPPQSRQFKIRQQDSNSVKKSFQYNLNPAIKKNTYQIQTIITTTQNKSQNRQNSNLTDQQIIKTNTLQPQFQQNFQGVTKEENKLIHNYQKMPLHQVRGESLQQNSFVSRNEKYKASISQFRSPQKGQFIQQNNYQLISNSQNKQNDQKIAESQSPNLYITPKPNLPINDSELQKNCYLYPIALFLGNSGVGKTSLIKIIFKDQVSNLKEFKLYPARINDSLIYNFVDTKGFDFESNIDEREEQIKLYKSIFYKYPNKVGSLFLVVNFERTDLMKKKLLSIYKFFRKFSSIISIIITEMQLSDNQKQSEAELKKNFAYFKPQNIIFVRRDIQREELIQKLSEKSLNKIQADYQFNVADTIFEKEDEEEMKKLQNQLMSRFK
ncbi:unnamed protein product [Paramecium sonneborni]|uniref:P-loop containing nucleoside triphosphate hydrolase n=1 Tax=Paramecium sonneborni TaxID=65129 RepID=A0A8S1RQH9_9CILI|nr:unnamed protein product [Paramecium sonneborni]